LSANESITTAVQYRDDIAVLAVGEVVDLDTAPALEEAIDSVLEEHPTALIVDLSAVTFLASVGLRLLVTTHERIGQEGQFAVVASGPATSRPIQLTNLDEVFALYPTLEDALAGLQNETLDRS
jgi:anti-sigma B factor antagonist